MTLDEKIARIVDRLLEKTLAGNVEWEQSSGAEVVCNLPEFMVGIREKEEYDDVWHVVSFYDENGQLMRTFTGVDIARGSELDELYRHASTQASGLDKKLDALLERLDRAS